MMSSQTLADVKDYYSNVLKTNNDLKTSACCPIDSVSPRIQSLLLNIHETVLNKFYGCGSPLPVAVEGCTVLDLGCGAGRDAFLLSQIVGQNGRVIGVDMTDDQLSVARQHIGWHMDKFGYKKPNVEFVKAYIEDLKAAGIPDNSVDVVISNCVINLSPDKESVFREIFRVLKPGGELYFSDIFTGRRVPEHLQNDKVMRGECLGGAMYTEDFRRLMRKVGVLDMRIMSKRRISLDHQDVIKIAGMIDFYSMTVRAFKIDLEDICENYGQVAYYKGTIPECPHSYVLDDHHELVTAMPMLVCGNTANMLSQTRLAKHFTITGNMSTHYGPFDCSVKSENTAAKPLANSGACC